MLIFVAPTFNESSPINFEPSNIVISILGSERYTISKRLLYFIESIRKTPPVLSNKVSITDVFKNDPVKSIKLVVFDKWVSLMVTELVMT